MKKLTLFIFLFTGYCCHSVESAQPEILENLLNFALTAIQNNGKAIARLADSIDRKLGVLKTELKDEIQQVRTEIQSIKNKLGNETLEVRTRIEAFEEKSLKKLFTEQKDLFEAKFASLNSTIYVNHDNLMSKAHVLVSDNKNGSAAIHKITTENRCSLDTLLLSALGVQEWITIQRRGTPLLAGRTREKFHNRTWTEYENGFGSQDADFWIGLEKMHKLTKSGFTELRVDLEDWEGNKAYASYSAFLIAGSWDNYRLTVSGYRGNAGADSLVYHNGKLFSTVDKDNDHNCAVLFGPWWHDNCSVSYLNFEYQSQGNVSMTKGIVWKGWKGNSYSLKKTEMKIRRPPSIS